MKNSSIALLAGVGILGYVLMKNSAAASGTSSATGTNSAAYANYLRSIAYQQNAVGYSGGTSPNNSMSYAGLIGAAANYVAGSGNSYSGSYGGMSYA